MTIEKPITLFEPAIIVTPDKKTMAQTAALALIEAFEKASSPLVVLPSGDTPLPVYHVMAEQYGRRREIWEALRYAELDEYRGLPEGHRQLFNRWLGRDLLDKVDVPAANRLLFDSQGGDSEPARMDCRIAEAGGIDVAVLGLGLNGHIGFNEPGSAFDSPTRTVKLSASTLASNRKYWDGEPVMPTAYTLGLGTLSKARQTFLLVSGSHKADILQQVLHGPISSAVPATYLRTIPNVTIICDKAAFGL